MHCSEGQLIRPGGSPPGTASRGRGLERRALIGEPIKQSAKLTGSRSKLPVNRLLALHWRGLKRRARPRMVPPLEVEIDQESETWNSWAMKHTLG